MLGLASASLATRYLCPDAEYAERRCRGDAESMLRALLRALLLASLCSPRGWCRIARDMRSSSRAGPVPHAMRHAGEQRAQRAHNACSHAHKACALGQPCYATGKGACAALRESLQTCRKPTDLHVHCPVPPATYLSAPCSTCGCCIIISVCPRGCTSSGSPGARPLESPLSLPPSLAPARALSRSHTCTLTHVRTHPINHRLKTADIKLSLAHA